LAVSAVRLDQPVALQSLQGRVYLADVQGPDLSGPRLELLTELEAVLGPLAQQGEQCVADAHGRDCLRSILSIVSGWVLTIKGLDLGDPDKKPRLHLGLGCRDLNAVIQPSSPSSATF